MKNFVRILSVVFFSSLAIIGCGGGGDEPVVPVPHPVPVVEKVEDVTFTNVTTNPLVTSVIPG